MSVKITILSKLAHLYIVSIPIDIDKDEKLPE